VVQKEPLDESSGDRLRVDEDHLGVNFFCYGVGKFMADLSNLRVE